MPNGDTPSADHIAGGCLLDLRREFLADALDDLLAVRRAVDEAEHGQRAVEDALNAAHRLAVTLKGGANSHELSLLGVAAHRLSDYLGAVERPLERHLHDVSIYVETLSDLVENDGRGPESAAHMVRRLPPRRSFDPSDIRPCEIEVLLVMGKGLVRRVIEREIQECGYRVTSVASPFEALELIVRTQPDLAILSAVLPDGLSGIDLAVGLKAMPETRNTSVAVITSFEREHESLKHLPPTVPIIRKGPAFADDLTMALSDQFLI
jgi:CheY-like chemotaxis protein/HPt (histidine-containing phosphotransfer) domain-containing protein